MTKLELGRERHAGGQRPGDLSERAMALFIEAFDAAQPGFVEYEEGEVPPDLLAANRALANEARLAQAVGQLTDTVPCRGTPYDRYEFLVPQDPEAMRAWLARRGSRELSWDLLQAERASGNHAGIPPIAYIVRGYKAQEMASAAAIARALNERHAGDRQDGPAALDLQSGNDSAGTVISMSGDDGRMVFFGPGFEKNDLTD